MGVFILAFYRRTNFSFNYIAVFGVTSYSYSLLFAVLVDCTSISTLNCYADLKISCNLRVINLSWLSLLILLLLLLGFILLIILTNCPSLIWVKGCLAHVWMLSTRRGAELRNTIVQGQNDHWHFFLQIMSNSLDWMNSVAYICVDPGTCYRASGVSSQTYMPFNPVRRNHSLTKQSS